MSYRSTTPKEASALLESNEGWSYIDVRTVEEFQAGHPRGAWNVPVFVRGPMGMQPNPEFEPTVKRHFAKDAKLLIGCQAGGRSAQACMILAASGYTSTVNVEGGFGGGRDQLGRPIAGWAASGLPVESAAPAERTFAGLKQKS
jgi:rhodanese-related sulfurtransferase